MDCILDSTKKAVLAVHDKRKKATQLLTQIQRAAGTEQAEVLKWLVNKYPKKAKDLPKDTWAHFCRVSVVKADVIRTRAYHVQK